MGCDCGGAPSAAPPLRASISRSPSFTLLPASVALHAALDAQQLSLTGQHLAAEVHMLRAAATTQHDSCRRLHGVRAAHPSARPFPVKDSSCSAAAMPVSASRMAFSVDTVSPPSTCKVCRREGLELQRRHLRERCDLLCNMAVRSMHHDILCVSPTHIDCHDSVVVPDNCQMDHVSGSMRLSKLRLDVQAGVCADTDCLSRTLLENKAVQSGIGLAS